MGELTAEMVNAQARAEALARVEERIGAHMQRAGEELLEIGRCLNEAKDKELVSHGKWQAWVQEQTGMDVRTAQNWMRAAREIPEGSPLGRLSRTKIVALLSLPQEEREDAAREMDAEHASSREVQRAVAERNAMRRERDEALRQIGAIRDARGKEMDEAVRREAEIAAERDRLTDQLRDAQGEMARLRDEIRQAQQRGDAIPAQAMARIQTLERELDAMSDKYDEAQDEIARLRRRRGGEASEGMTMEAVCAACGTFMGAVGALAQMLPGSKLPETDAMMLRGQAEMIREWAQRVLACL